MKLKKKVRKVIDAIQHKLNMNERILLKEDDLSIINDLEVENTALEFVIILMQEEGII